MIEKPLISVKNLNKHFFILNNTENILKRIFKKKKIEIKAVKNLNLEISKGEIVGVLGKNGAGKTTLIKMLTGILTPSEGYINVMDFCPQKNRYEYSYLIGVVLGQKSLLWYNIPVIESFKIYKSIYELDDINFNKRLDEFNDIFDIKSLMNIPVRKLSLGQRMKCEIVAALLHEPKILFLDEPTIGLDVISKDQIHTFLKQLNEKFNTTIILTTHNLEDVEKICNRIVLIDNGEKIYDGDKETLLKLDDKKIITIKGNITIPYEIKDMIISKNIGEYQLQCVRDQLDLIWNILGKIQGISDIEIKNSNLESIVSRIYKGELII